MAGTMVHRPVSCAYRRGRAPCVGQRLEVVERRRIPRRAAGNHSGYRRL